MLNRFILFAYLFFTVWITDLSAQNKVPRFEDFSVSGKFKSKPAPVNLRSHPIARKYRTMLRSAVEHGVNFAGHYTVAKWGCGTQCQYVAIIDARNGNVYFAPFNTSYGISFRLNSRLLITEPPGELDKVFGEAPNRPVDSVYFKWTGKQLVLLHPKKPQQIIDRYP